MRPLLAEIAPAAPAAIDALAILGPLAGALFIVGCIYVIDHFIRALFGTVSGAVGWIPFVGKIISAPIHAIEQKVTHSLGSAERRFDAYIATSWHKLGMLVRHIGRELEDAAKLALGVALALTLLPTKALVHYLIRVATRPLRAGIHTLEREYKGIEHGVKTLDRELDHVVIPRLRAAEHAIEGVIEPELAGVRARERALEHGAVSTWEWIRRHPFSVASAAFAAAVAVALGRLGAGWIRCRN